MKTLIAKANNEDLESTFRFLELCDFILTDQNIEELDPTDPLCILYNKIIQDIDIQDVDITNPLEVRYEMLRRVFMNCSGRWIKTMNAAVIMVEQICDPNVNYIELHPFFKRANQNSMLGE